MPSLTPNVRAAVLSSYSDVAQSLGCSPPSLLDRFGIPRRALAHPEQMLNSDHVVALLNETARMSECESIGLRLAERWNLSNLGAISLLISQQNTLEDALKTVIRYQHFLNEAVHLRIENSGSTSLLKVDVFSATAMPLRQANELALAVLVKLCRCIVEPNWRPWRVDFMHAPPKDIQPAQRFFACRVNYNAECNAVVFQTSDLRTRNPLSNPDMIGLAHRLMEDIYADRVDATVHRVRSMIYALLPTGRSCINQIAQAMCMETRTLQRRLAACGWIYSDLVNKVRRSLALHYVSELNYSFVEISAMLGFASQSSFTRWFIAQYEAPPSSWRRHRRVPQ